MAALRSAPESAWGLVRVWALALVLVLESESAGELGLGLGLELELASVSMLELASGLESVSARVMLRTKLR